MSKKIATTMLLLLGAALASNCGGDSTAPPASNDGGAKSGSSGSPGEAGESSSGGSKGGALSGGGTGAGGAGDAGNAATAGTGELSGGASGAAGETGAAGDSGGAGGAVGTSICPENIEDFPKLYAEAICRKRVQCCANDAEACLTEVSQALAELYPDLAKSEQDGSAERNCSALEQCVAAVDAAACSAWPLEVPMVFGVPAGEPACRNIIKGKLAASVECSSTYQCDNGFCLPGETEQDPAHCYPLTADGQSCSEASSLCNLATSYCNEEDKCAARLPNGAACTSVDECMSRRCDTVDTHKCLAPAENQCEFVPQACSLGRGPVRDSLAWPLLVMGLVLGAGARRRSRVARAG